VAWLIPRLHRTARDKKMAKIETAEMITPTRRLLDSNRNVTVDSPAGTGTSRNA